MVKLICCKSCEKSFTPNPRARNQRYCSDAKCQRSRKSNWERDQCKNNSDYRSRQRSAQQKWLEKNPNYWRERRASHSEYTEKNRVEQKRRDHRETPLAPESRRYNGIKILAKMDALTSTKSPIETGVSLTIWISQENLAKMDASTGKVYSLSMC